MLAGIRAVLHGAREESRDVKQQHARSCGARVGLSDQAGISNAHTERIMAFAESEPDSGIGRAPDGDSARPAGGSVPASGS